MTTIQNEPALLFLRAEVEKTKFGDYGLNRLPFVLYGHVAEVMQRYADHVLKNHLEKDPDYLPPLNVRCDHKGGAEYHCRECCPGNCEMHQVAMVARPTE